MFFASMATKPLTNEAIALTEKKMDMTLDDIIKMSKKTSSKAKNIKPLNKSQGFSNGRANQANSKVQHFMDSRSSIRQGMLAQRRSNFQGAQFTFAKEAAKKAAVTFIRNRVPIRNRAANWKKPRVVVPPVQKMAVESGFVGGRAKSAPKQRPQTLDSLFANMKEQRMRVLSKNQMHGRQNAQRNGPRQQQQRQRGVTATGSNRTNY